MTSKEVISILKKDGWFEVTTKGSHKQFKHNVKKGRVTVSHPYKDMNEKTLKSIGKQAGIKII